MTNMKFKPRKFFLLDELELEDEHTFLRPSHLFF